MYQANDSFSIPVFTPVIQPMYELFYTGSAFMTVLLTLERYLRIVHTDKSETWCTNKRIIGWIFCASIFALLLNIPYYMSYTWDKNGDAQLSDFGLSSQFYIVYESWGYFIFRFLFPWLLLVVLSTLVISKVSCYISNYYRRSLVLLVGQFFYFFKIGISTSRFLS